MTKHLSKIITCLACAGLFIMSGCGSGPAQGDPVLKAGAAAVVVTPLVEPFEDLNQNRQHDQDEPYTDLNSDGQWNEVFLGRYGANRPALGVHDDLYARVLVLERGDIRIGIVSIDWVGLFHDHSLEFKQAADLAGLELDHLIVSCTHNHEAPDTLGIWGDPAAAQTGRDDEYIAKTQQQTIAALTEAISELAPVKIIAGVGMAADMTDDSRLPIVKNETVTALRFDRIDDSGVVATVVHWSNHVESMYSGNRLITADFPFGLVAELEEAEPGSVGIFWQGTVGGLMNPYDIDIEDEEGNLLPEPSFERTERYGRIVAQIALETLATGKDIGDRLAFRRKLFMLPFDNLDLKLAAVGGLISRTPYDENGNQRELEDIFNYEPHIQTEITVLDLGEAQIVTVPGEIYPELVLEGPNGETYYEDPQDPGADFYGTECVKPVYHYMRPSDYRMVLGLANDELGYIIPKCQFDCVAPYTYGRDDAQYGEGVSAGPETAPIILEVISKELSRLND
ncbi:MAG: hypothetical protein JRJ87_14825 [Deltaproteobacteria bacterium]|nr:hypothetical protein [Deltaproteobacteria bacterium]